MNKVETRKGRLYGVCCGGDCVVTDDETGNQLLSLDGSKQEVFIAPGSAVWVTDDSAVVTELFKLAPCHGVAAMLLLRKAGGWLPKGYVELEYIETSGTQFLDTGLRGCDLSSLVEFVGESKTNARRAFQGQGFAFMSVNGADLTHYAQIPVGLNRRRIGYLAGVPYGGLYSVRIAGGKIEVNGTVFAAEDFRAEDSYESDNDATGYALTLFSYPAPTQQTGSRWSGTCRRFRAKLLSGAVDFVPLLRLADNVAGMWDRVSRQFFIPPAGAGTFGWQLKNVPAAAAYSLRGRSKPGYMPPSGVWARPAGVNGLEVVADTEVVSGAGWLHFDDSAAAEEHFGVVQEEILTE